LRRSNVALLSLAYLALLLDLTLVRWTDTAVPPDGRLNSVPLEGIAQFLSVGGWPMIVNVLGNVAAFVPFGFLIPLLRVGRTGVARIALLSLALSALIETLQYLSGRRVADVDDLLLNTLGGVLGYLSCACLRGKNKLTRDAPALTYRAKSRRRA
jgi:glycopeptide antibiotics resistance protein